MPDICISHKLAIQPGKRLVWSLLVAESVILSLLHHRYNFWGWPWSRQFVIIVIVAPLCALLLDRLLLPLWPDLAHISGRRWLLFLVPAVVIGAFAAWHFLSMPEVQHWLEIVPFGKVQLKEIRVSYGNPVSLSKFANVGGWTLRDAVLSSAESGSSPIRYSFVGPIDEQVRVSFIASAQGGRAQVQVDDTRAAVDLSGPDGDERRARLNTAYRWGPFNFLIVPIILAADFCTVLFLLTALWLMQELTQTSRRMTDEQGAERFLSHVQAIGIVCAVAIAFHVVNFLSVPLAVLKDSPSYLQGAAFWIRYHSLDGVSSYRGPGMSLLFAPAMALFGRNPLGVKLALHLLAIGCVPLSYRLGWQLGRRRWFAFAAGLLTTLIPDLYAYSSYVLSEAPHVFVMLLFCTLLLSALKHPSLRWTFAALLAGSFAALVRPENLAALLLGILFILAKLVWARWAGEDGNRLPWWQFGLALLAAVLPLLAWSAHNQRVYGFFGVSDYGGEILYDGWIYYGENAPISITDRSSPAVGRIEAVHSIAKPAQGDAPTGWTLYYALLQQGYTSEQAFSLLQRAALDSIRARPADSLKLLVFKLRQGFEPQPFLPATFTLPGEQSAIDTLNSEYFDAEQVSLPPLIHLQRRLNDWTADLYGPVFTVWFWLGVVMLFICIYRHPFWSWFPLAVLAANAILLPSSIGMAMWRYVLFGVVLMQYPLLAGAQSAGRLLSSYVASIRRGRAGYAVLEDARAGSD